MKTILYVNHAIDKACGVYDFGIRHFASIKNMKNYRIIYLETNDIHSFFEKCNSEKIDAVVFNYMQILLPWVHPHINKYKCPKICIPHDFYKDNLTSFKKDSIFDYYIIPDKSTIEDEICFKTDRPLTIYSNNRILKNEIPTIGSFGFALDHKHFDKIAAHTNECFEKAIINFHMPKAYFDSQNQTHGVIEACMNKISKLDIKINITTDFIDEIEVIKRLNKNDINCLFYDRDKNLGISSSLDYLVSAQKPILITESKMFRSFSSKLPIYPETSLKDIYDNFEKFQNETSDCYKNSIQNIVLETENILDRIFDKEKLKRL